MPSICWKMFFGSLDFIGNIHFRNDMPVFCWLSMGLWVILRLTYVVFQDSATNATSSIKPSFLNTFLQVFIIAIILFLAYLCFPGPTPKVAFPDPQHHTVSFQITLSTGRRKVRNKKWIIKRIYFKVAVVFVILLWAIREFAGSISLSMKNLFDLLTLLKKVDIYKVHVLCQPTKPTYHLRL